MKRYFVEINNRFANYEEVNDLLKSTKDLTLLEEFDSKGDAYCKWELKEGGIFVSSKDRKKGVIATLHNSEEGVSRIKSKLEKLGLELIPKK